MDIDHRNVNDIENRIRELARGYVPEWHYDPEHADIGAAIAKITDDDKSETDKLKEEYLKAGLMPTEDELPDYLPMYLQYVASMGSQTEAHAAIDDIRGVLSKMDDRFRKERHPYEPLIALLKEL